MRFAWKVTMVTLTVIVLSFSVGSYLLVSLSFHSALDRETAGGPGGAGDAVHRLRRHL